MVLAAIMVAFRLLPKIKDAAEKAEEIYSGAKMGIIKKKYVMDIISMGLDELDEWVDGTAEYKAMILKTVDSFIELVVGGFNLTGQWDTKLNLADLEGQVIQL